MLMKERDTAIGQRVPMPHCKFFVDAGTRLCCSRASLSRFLRVLDTLHGAKRTPSVQVRGISGASANKNVKDALFLRVALSRIPVIPHLRFSEEVEPGAVNDTRPSARGVRTEEDRGADDAFERRDQPSV